MEENELKAYEQNLLEAAALKDYPSMLHMLHHNLETLRRRHRRNAAAGLTETGLNAELRKAKLLLAGWMGLSTTDLDTKDLLRTAATRIAKGQTKRGKVRW